MGYEKLKSSILQQMRHRRLEKRVLKKEESAAAQSLLWLKHVDDGASSASPQEELSVGSQTEIDSLRMERMATELQQLRLEKN